VILGNLSSGSFRGWSETISDVADGFDVNWAVRRGFDLGSPTMPRGMKVIDLSQLSRPH